MQVSYKNHTKTKTARCYLNIRAHCFYSYSVISDLYSLTIIPIDRRLIILGFQLEITLGMRTHRTFLGSFLTEMDMSAVRTLPHAVSLS